MDNNFEGHLLFDVNGRLVFLSELATKIRRGLLDAQGLVPATDTAGWGSCAEICQTAEEVAYLQATTVVTVSKVSTLLVLGHILGTNLTPATDYYVAGCVAIDNDITVPPSPAKAQLPQAGSSWLYGVPALMLARTAVVEMGSHVITLTGEFLSTLTPVPTPQPMVGKGMLLQLSILALAA